MRGITAGDPARFDEIANTAHAVPILHNSPTGAELRHENVQVANPQLRTAIARRNDDPGSIASREFSGSIFARRLLGRLLQPVLGLFVGAARLRDPRTKNGPGGSIPQ
jgi:hypothetical protein